MKHTINNYKGALLGGAVGDALGYPIEFMNLEHIRKVFGENGLYDYVLSNTGKALISDDTQMTMFTADGLIKSTIKNKKISGMPDFKIIYRSYLNWLKTQFKLDGKIKNEGWITDLDELYSSRAPGNTCFSALLRQKCGSTSSPINSSKGCGGVMRVAPVGLMYYRNPAMAFKVGMECAAMTHGDPSAYLPAGIHSAIIANILQGKKLVRAIEDSIKLLKQYPKHNEVMHGMLLAKSLAKKNVPPTEAIKTLGEGWCGDEAIFISTYCALKSQSNFRNGVLMAVNHSGDSDSTGAITGNILGAYLGLNRIPQNWREKLELRDELLKLASDLYVKTPHINTDIVKRYPINF